MQKRQNLSIPKPCHENWDAMSASPSGKFCASCAKNVIDFAQKSEKEILELLNKSNGEVCGRFKKSQIDGLRVEIPESVFYTKMPFQRAFLLVLFTTMGAMLFSCSDDEGNVQSIDSVEVVERESDQWIVMGAVSFDRELPREDIHDNITTPSFLHQIKNSPFFEQEVTLRDTSQIPVSSADIFAVDTLARPSE
ncbi:hypothetical protein [Flavobacterium sp.]|uniref:hypothetical protein n=1 Tax=Flavobacterium sp. TaxID=239 RepID=UPI0011F4E607|nr:hypothetical protein [Flavobacterium sp.]RZJ73911.1 MAG: hypothetical protein EOO49_00720 [Flavobacterium sp.]